VKLGCGQQHKEHSPCRATPAKWIGQTGHTSRLRLFSKIFPIVALITAAIPGLYPLWMVTEQICFALILLGIAEYLSTDHMREAYAKPPRAPRVPKRVYK
jgi:hypothetical protein